MFNNLNIEPTQDEIAKMKVILDQIKQLEPQLLRMRKAGIDVTSSEQQLAATKEKIEKILREYDK